MTFNLRPGIVLSDAFACDQSKANIGLITLRLALAVLVVCVIYAWMYGQRPRDSDDLFMCCQFVAAQVCTLEDNVKAFGVTYFPLNDARQVRSPQTILFRLARRQKTHLACKDEAIAAQAQLGHLLSS
eukprot:scaffold482274_cov19-Prasinocladus_malaysianus.AAC.1